ncbi:MAG: hypothetical protein GX146_01135 [Myxococcales bacterium]|jgi:glycerol-3-phosphate O-acyltransferase|nr:hypothetical protein [Myxococcales bacterium]
MPAEKKNPLRIPLSLLMHLFQSLLLRYVRFSEDWIDTLRCASAKGPVIIVLRNRNLIDFLCLRGICQKSGLPPLGFVSGLSPFWFLPLWKFLPALFSRRSETRQKQRLQRTLEHGGTALVFLRRPAIRDAFGSRPVALDGIRLAVEVQRETQLPLQALPTVFLWGENPMKRPRSNLYFLFGTSEYPRILRALWLLMRRRSNHGQWSSDVIDIGAIAQDKPTLAAQSGILRAAVGRRIEEIRRERLGTFTKPSSRIKAEVIASGRLKKELASLAETQQMRPEEISHRVVQIVEKLATDFKPHVVSAFALLMAFVWKRLYTTFDIRKEDTERMRAAEAAGPLLLLPCHRSHIDYLAITQAMNTANLMLPHIAAGDNLDFWPMGPVFRASGAFFIRRRFINDKFYTAVVNTYIRRLIHEGYAIEIFIEGGRSRTGKLLRPHTGMLEMVLHAMATIPDRIPGILPTYIGYERVIEEASYLREVLGKKKKSESIFSVLKTAKVLFKNYGRLYVRTGHYFSVQDVLNDLGHEIAELTNAATRREVAQEIGFRTLAEIQTLTIATATSVIATAALSLPQKRFTMAQLWDTARVLLRYLQHLEADLSPELHDFANGLDSAVPPPSFVQTVQTLQREKRFALISGRPKTDPETAVFEIRSGQRRALDFYKNSILHFFAPAAFLAPTLLQANGEGAPRDHLVEATTRAAKIFQWEFILPGCRTKTTAAFEKARHALTDSALQHLGALGHVAQDGDRFSVQNADALQLFARLLRNFHELYATVLQVAKDRGLGRYSGDIASETMARLEHRRKHGDLFFAECRNHVMLQTAQKMLKDYKLNRFPEDENPFVAGGVGDDFLHWLTAALSGTEAGDKRPAP